MYKQLLGYHAHPIRPIALDGMLRIARVKITARVYLFFHSGEEFLFLVRVQLLIHAVRPDGDMPRTEEVHGMHYMRHERLKQIIFGIQHLCAGDNANDAATIGDTSEHVIGQVSLMPVYRMTCGMCCHNPQ